MGRETSAGGHPWDLKHANPRVSIMRGAALRGLGLEIMDMEKRV